MFRPENGMNFPPQQKEYAIPDMTDVKSWDLAKLESEYAKLDAEHKRLTGTMERPDGTNDGLVINKLKELGAAGRTMFFEIEKHKKAA